MPTRTAPGSSFIGNTLLVVAPAESLRRAQLAALSASNRRPGAWAMLTRLWLESVGSLFFLSDKRSSAVNRRHFVGQVVLGSTFASFVRRPLAAQDAGGLRVKFVGMMGYVTQIRSVVAGRPSGRASHGALPPCVVSHGSRRQRRLPGLSGLTAMPGVVGRCVRHDARRRPRRRVRVPLPRWCRHRGDIHRRICARSTTRRPSWRRCRLIAPGKRLRNNLRRWARSTFQRRRRRARQLCGPSRCR